MEVRCERCRAQYVFSDDQVGEQGLTVRCSNCGHLFKVKKKALVVTMPVSDDAAEGAVSAADTQRAAAVQAAAKAVKAEGGWALRQPSGQTYAFRDMATLHRWIVERKAHREDEISRGNEPWRRLGAIPELQSFFAVVEAAERASRTPPPPTQPTAVQYPVAVFPGPGAPPPATKTDQAFPAAVPKPAPARGDTLPSLSAKGDTLPAAAAPGDTLQGVPAKGETLQSVPAAPARTEAAFPPPPAPAAESPLANLFTPEPFVPPREDPFAAAAPPGDTRPDHAAVPLSTAQGFPAPPPPAGAPLRATAAWEGEAPLAPAGRSKPEPAWTSADQQTTGHFLDEPKAPARERSRGGGAGPAIAIAAIVLALVGGAGWWFLLREEPARPTAVPAPAPQPGAAEKKPAPPPQPAPAEPTPAPTPADAVPPAPAAGAAAPAEPPPQVPPASAPAPENPAAPPAAAESPAAPPTAADKPAPAPPVARPAAPPEPKGAKAFVAQARKALDRGKAQQALDLYGRAVALEPRNVAALAGRGWSYLELSQYAPAEASFQSALEVDEGSPTALLGLAETYRYEGRRAEAVKYYERYLAVSPNGEDAVAAQNAIKSLKE